MKDRRCGVEAGATGASPCTHHEHHDQDKHHDRYDNHNRARATRWQPHRSRPHSGT